MKKTILIAFILSFNFIALSQDIIMLQNGDELKASVLKIELNSIVYKKFNNLNGPEYSLNKSDVFMIKYKNGEKDIFGLNSSENTQEYTNANSMNSNNNNYVGKEISYYDGVPVISYSTKEAVLAMSLRKGRKYGKYYIAEIMIFNNTGKKIDFIPKHFIYPTFINKGIASSGSIMSYKEYNRKVKNYQTWSAIALGVASAYNASQAGYSTSYTSGSVSGYGTSTTNTNAYGSGSWDAFGNGWSAYGSGNWNAYGTSTTNSSINLYGSSTTTTYDAGKAYAASQNSARDMANFAAYQKVKKEQIQYEYLKRHTLKNGEEISGKINIPYKKADIVEVTILMDGTEYVFDFTTDLILKIDD